MIVQNSTKCNICGKVFCCLKCRFKHEENTHEASESCPICLNQKIVLRSSINSKLVKHITEKHLPLQCVKCSKIYVNSIDMINATQCTTNIIIDTKDKKLTSSLTQSSVHSLAENKAFTPPVAITEHQCRVQNKITADSAYLLKNSFLDNNSTSKNENNKGTVVRTTSTPMQGTISSTQKKNVFDSSGNHVSSIYASGSESEISPPIIILTPTSPRPEMIVDRLNKHHMAMSFHKKPVTPLRQVISNNIRRAITEHGIENLKCQNIKPKKIFDFSGSPLDLRTSPALRRVQSEIIEKSYSFDSFDSFKTSTKQCLSISSKKTTESILIKSTKASVYATCRSISVITSTELQKVSLKKNTHKISTNSTVNSIPFTPKTEGVIKKKTIDFKTPTDLNSEFDDDDVFYTPMSTFSNGTVDHSLNNDECTKLKDNINNNKYNTDIKQNQNDMKKKNDGKLWSIVTSMMQIPSFARKREECDNSQSFLKRCASFAGYISKSQDTTSDDGNELQSLKRRRNTATESIETSAKRVKRIQGRKPIERMRKFSIQN